MAKPSPFLYAVSVVKAKVTPRGDALPSPRDLVLTDADLPDGWRTRSTRESLTGMAGAATEWGARARALKGRTYVAVFSHGNDRFLGITSQAIPLASAADAADALPIAFDRLLMNPDPMVQEVGREDVALGRPPGEGALAIQLWGRNLRFPDLDAVSQLVVWHRGPVLCMLQVAGARGAWATEDIERLAAIQDARVVSVIDHRAGA